MRSGFNTNVRHRGTLFHVQTEDSGRANPHLITHLFFEGTILASDKQSYAELEDDEALAEAVKQRMETQHLGMLERLRAGALDDEIETRLGSDAFREAASADAGSTHPDLDADAPETSASPPRRRRSAAPADAPLDELVLDYLAERGPRPPGTR